MDECCVAVLLLVSGVDEGAGKLTMVVEGDGLPVERNCRHLSPLAEVEAGFGRESG